MNHPPLYAVLLTCLHAISAHGCGRSLGEGMLHSQFMLRLWYSISGIWSRGAATSRLVETMTRVGGWVGGWVELVCLFVCLLHLRMCICVCVRIAKPKFIQRM